MCKTDFPRPSLVIIWIMLGMVAIDYYYDLYDKLTRICQIIHSSTIWVDSGPKLYIIVESVELKWYSLGLIIEVGLEELIWLHA